MSFDAIPYWIKGATLFIALMLAVEIGFHLDGWLRQWNVKLSEGRSLDGWSILVSGSVSLLTLLLAFTVNMANAHYEARRQLVIDEANAMSTTYQRAQLLAEPARTEVSGLIERYALGRRAIFLAGDVRGQIERAQSASEDDQARLWATTVAALKDPTEAPHISPLLQAMNPMFEVAARRHEALQVRVPARIILVLAVDGLLTLFLVGYSLAPGRNRRPVASSLFCAMVAMTMALIFDLDHPQSGGISVREGPLERATLSIQRAEAVKVAPH